MLNQEAFAMFIDYRKSIKKPVKTVSEHALRIKLEKMGSIEVQLECVNRSISNSWQGIFPPDTSAVKRAFQPTTKTEKQLAADSQALQSANERSGTHWDTSTDPLAKLLLCEALLGRYTVTGQCGDKDKMEALREITAKHIRAAKPSEIVGNPHLSGLVRFLFGERGIRRLKASCV